VLNRNSHNISVFLNNGDGTFPDPVYYGAGYLPNWIYAADLDNDSDNDLAVANQGDNVLVLLNNGDGTFQEADSYGAGYWPQGVFAADLDNDSDNDLIVANKNSDDVSVLVNLTIASNIDDPSETSLPGCINLFQNYPNPFNAMTNIGYELPKESQVTIEIYDMLGKSVGVIQDGSKQAGYHQAIWKADNYVSGIYFYKIQAGDYSETKKMVLIK
jgi:hypothetical protein